MLYTGMRPLPVHWLSAFTCWLSILWLSPACFRRLTHLDAPTTFPHCVILTRYLLELAMLCACQIRAEQPAAHRVHCGVHNISCPTHKVCFEYFIRHLDDASHTSSPLLVDASTLNQRCTMSWRLCRYAWAFRMFQYPVIVLSGCTEVAIFLFPEVPCRYISPHW